jgi:TIM-barrel protein
MYQGGGSILALNLRHPSVLGAMAGRNDGTFCKNIGMLGVGMVTVGGISADEITMQASREMVDRGRKEFLFSDMEQFLETHIPTAQESQALVCVNVRSATLSGYLKAAEIITDLGAVVEINAHCRQKEMVERGAGQHLLDDLPILKGIIEALHEVGIKTILKFRGNVIPEQTILEIVQPDAVHIDAYREGEKGFDFTVFKKISAFTCFKIGNNSINTPEIAKKVLNLCDAFSFAQSAWNDGAVRSLVEGV